MFLSTVLLHRQLLECLEGMDVTESCRYNGAATRQHASTHPPYTTTRKAGATLLVHPCIEYVKKHAETTEQSAGRSTGRLAVLAPIRCKAALPAALARHITGLFFFLGEKHAWDWAGERL